MKSFESQGEHCDDDESVQITLATDLTVRKALSKMMRQKRVLEWERKEMIQAQKKVQKEQDEAAEAMALAHKEIGEFEEAKVAYDREQRQADIAKELEHLEAADTVPGAPIAVLSFCCTLLSSKKAFQQGWRDGVVF